MSIVLLRTVFFYVMTILAMRLMGKRQIGELEPSELVITIIISELATIPMQDREYPVVNIVVAIIILVALEIFSSILSIKSRSAERVLSGQYNVIVENGVINQTEMKKAQVTVSELYEEIRQNGAMDISEVKFCILETSGQMSVILKNNTEQNSIPYPLIVDGKLLYQNLSKANITEKQLLSEAKRHKANCFDDVFLCIRNSGNTEWILKDGKS